MCDTAGSGSVIILCGNGTVEGIETCDDGNTATGDGCDNTCTIETGYECAGAPSSCSPDCGDNMII